MKLGLAFVRSNLTRDNLRFARQVGVTHVVVHYADYNRDHDKLPDKFKGAYGFTGNEPIWTYDELRDLRQMVNERGPRAGSPGKFQPRFLVRYPAGWSRASTSRPRT